MKIRWVIFALIFVALLMSAVQPVLAQEGKEPQGLRPDAPEYALRGPHWVGYRPIVIGEDTDRPLDVGLWYPALNPEGAAEEIAYELPGQPWSDEDTIEIYGHALLDAPVDYDTGPYPLIVFSHGFSGSPEWYTTLIEHYASHGFVVLAPKHAGESDWMENATPTVTRLSDMVRTLDYAEAATAADGELAGLLDMDNVAAVGHSYGGYTALAMAGAQFDMAGFAERCATLTEDDPNIFLCLPLIGKEEQLAEGLGLDSVPDGLWPSFGDPRVTAAVSMAGDSYIFDKAGLAQITIPVLAIGGTADTGTDYNWGIKPTYDYAASEKKALFAFNGGEHMIMGNPCEQMPFLLESDAYGFACTDPVWDKLRGLDLTNHATTAFLLDTLKGDQAARAALAPEAVNFYGIEYQAEGYGPAVEVADSAPEMKAHTPREDAPAFGVRGPYAVGVRDFVIEPEQEGGRPIPVSVWYPALNPDGRPEATTYMLDFDNPDFPNFSVAGRALRDAQPDAAGGPYPLVVYSHGYWLFRQVSSFLMEQLASHGFIVIAGDHMDNWGGIFGASQVEDYVIRPQEVAAKIDFAEKLNEANGAFPGLIDLEHVGVTGHSFGADTTLLVGGGRLNTDVFMDEWCAMHPGDAEDPLNDCFAMPDKLDEMIRLAGLDTVPEGLWPDWSDPRVDAIAPLAPGPQYFGTEGLATVKVPILLFESELDWAQGLASAYYEPYTALPAGLSTHVLFRAGDHGLFLNGCGAMPAWLDFGFSSFCQDRVWDANRAHDLIDHFVTAFMLAELKGDADAAAALAPDSVDFPGVEYETSEFGVE